MTLMIRGLRWDISTSGESGAGSDARMDCDILRDGSKLLTAILETGETERLDRGNFDSLFLKFKRPFYALPINESLAQGVVGVEFPEGIAGHLTLRLRSRGDDKWIKEIIDVFALFGELIRDNEGGGLLVFDPGDQWKFIGRYNKRQVLSTDPNEGLVTLDLLF